MSVKIIINPLKIIKPMNFKILTNEFRSLNYVDHSNYQPLISRKKITWGEKDQTS